MSVYHSLRRAYRKIMREFKEDITITHISSQTVDTYDRVSNTTADVETQGVIYRFTDEYSEFGLGNLKTGEIAFLLGKDETVTETDTITHNSIDYHVRRVERLKTKGGLVGIIAYCEKK